MSKICAKCDKPVYPTEELKCLDKVWHKGCFKCWECGMSLNMKNYKGYDKKPYCNAHYPQTKATVVAETPEIARLTQASKNQSQAKYHEEFEKKIKGSKIQVADDPETQRLRQLNSIVSQVEYKGLKEKVNEMEAHRSSLIQSEVATRPDMARPRGSVTEETAAGSDWSSPYTDRSVSHSVAYTSTGKVEAAGGARKIGSIADYNPGAAPPVHSAYNPVGVSMRQRQEWEETVPMTSSVQSKTMVYSDVRRSAAAKKVVDSGTDENGDDTGYDPVDPVVSDINQQIMTQQQEQQKLAREQQMRESLMREQELREQQQRERDARERDARDREMQLRDEQAREQQLHEQQLREQKIREQQIREQQIREQQMREQQQLRDEQIREQQLREQQIREQQIREQQLREQQMREQAARMQPAVNSAPPGSQISGPVYQAMYDYEAQDDDEVGFQENDLVVDVLPIDDGWMFGTVQRTGLRGMLPANYVERVQ